jgi:hypothetical protein
MANRGEIAKKIRKRCVLCALGGSIWQPENRHGDFEKIIPVLFIPSQ